MYTFDEQEKAIIRQLIRNPRLSDNQIGKNTGISVKTVNRKRKLLEETGYLHYYAAIDQFATYIFTSRKLYVITLKPGITKKSFMEKLNAMEFREVFPKHIHEAFVGYHQGCLALFMVIESYKEDDIPEIFNEDVMSQMRAFFGSDAVSSTQVFDVAVPIRVFHNYAPLQNVHQGKLKQDWPLERIMVE